MSASNREIRNAAEVLLSGSCSSSQLPQNSPYSYFACRTIISDDDYSNIIRSTKMSDVRRFFCLLVTFDLLLTALMWLICMMLVSGGDIVSSLTSQVVHYQIQTSLFDIVMAAASRFTVLLLFYGLVRSNNWFAVAISTSGTCIFLIAKVFVFDWAKASQPTFQVMLILVSFVLAWGEAWFLDFRLIPQELKDIDLLFSSRNPLIRNFINNLNEPDNPESVANFYSPLDSPHDSDGEGSSISQSFPAPDSTGNQPEDYGKKAQEMMDIAWTLINSPDWQIEKETAEGETVRSKVVANGPKIFCLTAKIHMSAPHLLKQLFDHIEEMPQWNPTVLESERLEVLDDRTDITYQVSAPGGAGVVASRDFVVLRHWDIRDGAFVSASASILHPKKPPSKQHIRGVGLPGCWVMKHIPGEEGWCVFQWLLNTNLKGWLPQYVVDSAFTNVMLQFLEYLKAHVEKLRQESPPVV